MTYRHAERTIAKPAQRRASKREGTTNQREVKIKDRKGQCLGIALCIEQPRLLKALDIRLSLVVRAVMERSGGTYKC